MRAARVKRGKASRSAALVCLPLLLAAAIAVQLAVPGASHGRAQSRVGTSVLVVGDSLAVGLRPYLGAMLAPRTMVWDTRSGRTTPEGLARLRADLVTTKPKVLVVSLGTNDGPDRARFVRRIGSALKLLPAHTCVVWADIYRPARKGPYHALNVALHDVALRDARLHLVRWNAAVAHARVRLPDGLHPDPAGFDYRSRLFARAVARNCGVVTAAAAR